MDNQQAIRNDLSKENKKPVSSSQTYDDSETIKSQVLEKMIQFMKSRWLNGDIQSLPFNEILDQSQAIDTDLEIKNWLTPDALKNNPRISFDKNNQLVYKPPIQKIINKNTFLKQLKSHDSMGRGGYLLDDIRESLPRCDKILKAVEDNIIIVEGAEKKKVVFYNDKDVDFKVDDEMKEYWKDATVELKGNEDIERYLRLNDINPLEVAPKSCSIKRKKINKQQEIHKRLRDNNYDTDQPSTSKN